MKESTVQQKLILRITSILFRCSILIQFCHFYVTVVALLCSIEVFFRVSVISSDLFSVTEIFKHVDIKTKA